MYKMNLEHLVIMESKEAFKDYEGCFKRLKGAWVVQSVERLSV